MLRNSRVSLGRIKNLMRSSNVTLGNIEKINERGLRVLGVMSIRGWDILELNNQVIRSLMERL